MRLKGHDLRQLDGERLRRLREQDPRALEQLAVRLLEDLKEARERLNQNPDNSSRPPSSRAPWSRRDDETEIGSQDPPTDPKDRPAKTTQTNPASTPKGTSPRRPGKQKGAPGQARIQVLPFSRPEDHHPTHCAVGGAALPSADAICYTGYESVDLEIGDEADSGLRVISTQHRYFETACGCGHLIRCAPYRAPPAVGEWAGVALTEWRLIGPGLAAVRVWLHFRRRLPGRRCREFAQERLGLSLSTGAIQQALHEAAHACEPIPQRIQEAILEAELLHADETAHPQAGQPLWLWVVASATTVLFFIGRRTKALLRGRLGAAFAGWLMADGYGAYRDYPHRLRCWAHLIRKARALAETFTPHVQGYGLALLATFDRLIESVYPARAGPPRDLRPLLADDLAQLRALCAKMSRSRNAKAARLGRGLRNDWDAIFQVLAHPELPLTNNFAERLLRHWVIMRRITYGTRSHQGSRALATFASVIETCRLRNASPLRYLHQVIAASRKGHELPALPPVPVAS